MANQQPQGGDEEKDSDNRSFPVTPLQKVLPPRSSSTSTHVASLPVNLHKIPKVVLLLSLAILLANFAPLRHNPLLHLYQYFSSPSSSLTRTTTTTTTTITTTTMTTTINSTLNVCPSSLISTNSTSDISLSPPSPSPLHLPPPPFPHSPPTLSPPPPLLSPPPPTPTLSPPPLLLSPPPPPPLLLSPPPMPPTLPPPPPPLLTPPPPPPTLPPLPPPLLSPPPTLPPPTLMKPKSTQITSKCDISRGEWIHDPEAPYYTNMTCSTIQEHQNCMKYGRPDTDFLKYRWKPQDCELARFDHGQFLEMVRGKSMIFIGDSLARNQMQSLMCLLSRVEYPQDISNPKDEKFHKRMFYTNYNFTLSIFWSPFFVKAREGPQNGPYQSSFWYLYLDEPDPLWISRLDQADYVLISGGNWFNRPSMYYFKGRLQGCLYCQAKNVKRLTMQYSNLMSFRTALRAISQRTKFVGTLILRSLSPSHFEKGTWDKGGDCVRRKPFRSDEAKIERVEGELYKAQLEEFKKAEREAKGRGITYKVLDMTEAMVMRPDGHPSRFGHWPNANVTMYNDCVHWCLPGPVDTWNDFLFHIMSN